MTWTLFPQVQSRPAWPQAVTSQRWHHQVEQLAGVVLCVLTACFSALVSLSLNLSLPPHVSLSSTPSLSFLPSPSVGLFPSIRCPNDYTGDRCQTSVMAGFYSMSISSSCLFVYLSALTLHAGYDVCACTCMPLFVHSEILCWFIM